MIARRSVAAMVALLSAAPAFATESLTCTPPGKAEPLVRFSIGHAAEPTISSAYFETDGAEVTVAVSQSWVDKDRMWVNLGDDGLENVIVQFRANGSGERPHGTLVYKGKTYKVRCVYDG